jgi:FAD/FMN-containing dehydrogenase
MIDSHVDLQRRRLLQAGAGSGCLIAAGCAPDVPPPPAITDVAQLEDMPVARIAQPVSTSDVVRALHQWRGPICVGGGRYSMGGQIADAASLHLDLRGMNRLVWLDPQARTVRAQAGMRWRDLLDHLDPHGLSVSIMQSFSNFTLGGSVSVNCHGRYVGKGPVVNSIRALQVVTADGQLHELDRQREPDLFAAVVGGYGGMGVVTEVELALDANTAMQREVEFVPLDDYPRWFRERVAGDADVLMHNADLVPPGFDAPLAISWRRTSKAPTVAERLIPRERAYGDYQTMIWAASELPGAAWLRQRDHRQMIEGPQPIVWRNYEASLDTDSLEPRTRAFSTYVLQEYFVPVEHFLAFARGMAGILRTHGVNALNVSIRHSPEDRTSLLRWAAGEVFCFVLYYKQRTHAGANRAVEAWAQKLIDLAIGLGGRYYLPYRLHATRQQFQRAYPEAEMFRQLKAVVDPQNRFRNRLWGKYLGDA